MPMFKITVTPNELDALIAQHPELINKTSIDDAVSAQILAYGGSSEDEWTPVNPWLRTRYEELKKRYSI